MVAHSFRGAVFGPAQALHGATFVIDAAFIAESLDDNGIVIDIGRAHDALKVVVASLNYRNLDELPEFKGRNTTTETVLAFLASQSGLDLSYPEVGATATQPPSGYAVDHTRVRLGDEDLRGVVGVVDHVLPEPAQGRRHRAGPTG